MEYANTDLEDVIKAALIIDESISYFENSKTGENRLILLRSISQTGLVDRLYYIEKVLEPCGIWDNPVKHYISKGFISQLCPNRLFEKLNLTLSGECTEFSDMLKKYKDLINRFICDYRERHTEISIDERKELIKKSRITLDKAYSDGLRAIYDLLRKYQVMQAQDICLRHLEKTPEDFELLLLMAENGIRLKRIDFIESALAKLGYPDYDPYLNVRLANVHVSLGHYYEAKRLFELVLAQNSDDNRVWLHLDTGLQRIRDQSIADSLYELAHAMAPGKLARVHGKRLTQARILPNRSYRSGIQKHIPIRHIFSTRYFTSGFKRPVLIENLLHNPETRGDYFRQRAEIFLRFCYPSLIAQLNADSVWYLIIDPVHIDAIGKTLPDLDKRVRLVTPEQYRSELDKLGKEWNGYVANTRIDNDDAVAIDFVCNLDKAIRAQSEETGIVVFPHGLQFRDPAICNTYMCTSPHFSTLFLKCPCADAPDIYATGPHTTIYDSKYGISEIITDLPMWVEYQHLTNQGNLERTSYGNLANVQDLLKTRFGVELDASHQSCPSYVVSPATDKDNIWVDIHCAFDGWLGERDLSMPFPVLPREKKIEAIRIRSNIPSSGIKYQVYYEREGWTDVACDGEQCGTTGRSRPIQGIKAWLEPATDIKILRYRIHSEGWSEWHSGGSEIINTVGFTGLEFQLGTASEYPAGSDSPHHSVTCHDPVVKRLNMLAETINASSYLEIGVRSGNTFFKIQVSDKTGVDPAFTFDISTYKGRSDIHLYKMTSDDFFGAIATDNPTVLEKGKYDLIYIDGLHTWQQALRDFINSQAVSTENAIWIFDDTLPCDPWSALNNQSLSYQLRETAGIKGRPWHGDVFKAIIFIHDFYPKFSYITVIGEGNPQTIVWRTRNIFRMNAPIINIDSLNSFSYFDLIKNYKILHPVKADSIKDYLHSKSHFPAFDDSITLEEIVRNKIISR